MFFIRGRSFLLLFFSVFLNHKKASIFKFLCIDWDDHIFPLYSTKMANYWLIIIRPNLHSWDKTHLELMDFSFYKFPDSIFQYFLRDISRYIQRDIDLTLVINILCYISFADIKKLDVKCSFLLYFRKSLCRMALFI